MPPKNVTSKPSRYTGEPLPRQTRVLRTVGALKKALSKWPDAMPIYSPVVVVTVNIGSESEGVMVDDADMHS